MLATAGRTSLVVFCAYLLTFCLVSCANEEPENGGSNSATDLPAFETRFSQPQPDQQDDRISETIIELVDKAPQGSEVRAAIYTFSREAVAEAFADAHDRGVDVRIVLGNHSTHDDGSDWTAVEILRDRLGEALFVCRDGQDHGGCIGENIQHNKFVVFSELDDGSEQIVVQTSANFTNAQLGEFDNLIIARGDTSLYDAYRSYWVDLRNEEFDPEYDRVEEGDRDTRVFFFPHSTGDPVVEALDDVDCQTGADVYVAMAFFTNSRSEIAETLRSLDDDGCGVHVVLREDSHTDSPGAQIEADMRRGDIDFGLFSDEADVQLHSKYFLVDGAYGDDGEDEAIVWTGSHNFTYSALRRNDETILEIRDREVFDDYLDDWKHLRQQAQHVHP